MAHILVDASSTDHPDIGCDDDVVYLVKQAVGIDMRKWP